MGRGESEAPGGGRGIRILLKSPGGFSRTGGAEGTGGCVQQIGEFLGGGGLNIFACNLIWWAVLGFQDVMKQQEAKRNKEKKTKTSRKKKHKTQQKPPRFCGGFGGHF